MADVLAHPCVIRRSKVSTSIAGEALTGRCCVVRFDLSGHVLPFLSIKWKHLEASTLIQHEVRRRARAALRDAERLGRSESVLLSATVGPDVRPLHELPIRSTHHVLSPSPLSAEVVRPKHILTHGGPFGRGPCVLILRAPIPPRSVSIAITKTVIKINSLQSLNHNHDEYTSCGDPTTSYRRYRFDDEIVPYVPVPGSTDTTCCGAKFPPVNVTA